MITLFLAGLWFFVTYLGSPAAILGGGWLWLHRRRQNAIAAQEKQATIEYRQHLAQLPAHIAQLEQEAGLDVARYTYDYDEYDKLISDGELAYCYSHLPSPDERWDEARQGFFEVKYAQDVPAETHEKTLYPCSKCGVSYGEEYYSTFDQRQTCTCSKCDQIHRDNQWGNAFSKLNPDAGCQVCGAKFDSGIHCAMANGAAMPYICAACHIQQQKEVTKANSVPPEWLDPHTGKVLDPMDYRCKGCDTDSPAYALLDNGMAVCKDCFDAHKILKATEGRVIPERLMSNPGVFKTEAINA